MTCAQCGYNVAAGAEACPRCGTRTAGNATTLIGPPDWTSGPAGNPAASPGYQGNPAASQGYQGNPAASPGYQGNPAASQGYQGNPAPSPGYQGNPAAAPGYQGYQGNPAAPPGYQANPPASAGFKFDARRWTLTDKIAGGASLVVLISLFLPWFSGTISADNALGLSAASGSESGTDAHGWLWLVFIIVLAIIGYLVVVAGFQVLPGKLPLRYDQVLLVAASVNLILVFIGFLLKPSTGGLAGVSISWSAGAFLALIAAIAAVAALTPAGRARLDS